ncbi:MAG: hypothetical protein WBA67_05570, partial [Jannaschia sp.]
VEALGWAGDAVRVHRARSALKTIARTKVLAQESGFQLTAPPLKFISQFIENASLEEEADDEIIEWWARLLLDAGRGFADKQIFFANVLKQVSGRELELLEVLVRNGRRSYRVALASEAEFVHDFSFNQEDLLLTGFEGDGAVEAAIDSLIDVFEIPGVLALDIFVDGSGSTQWHRCHPDYAEVELASWQILQSLQLARIDYQKFQQDAVQYRIRMVMLTQLGAEFFFSCHAPEFSESNSADVRFERRHRPD